MEESFTDIIEKLRTLKDSAVLTSSEDLCIAEAIARLKSVKKQSLKIIETNSTLLDRNSQLREMREMMTDDKVNDMLQEATKTDSSLAAYLSSVGGRVKKENSSEISTYDLSKPDESVPDIEEIMELHSETEAVYNNLWLVKERLNTISKFRRFNPKGVREVRNHLMIHTKGNDSGAHIYSFGIATRGPVLRPVKPSGVRAPHDVGYEANVEEFLNDLEKLLA